MLDLSARLLERNKAFTTALKQQKPQEELKAIHSEIQEIYNHISLFKEEERNNARKTYDALAISG